MLKYIKIKNFLSFNEETEINFESNNYWNLKWNVFSVWKNVLMKSCIIYWANASWKTNILRAINFIKNIALFSHETNFNANTTPFLLNSNWSNSPSFFEICFFIDNIDEYLLKLIALANHEHILGSTIAEAHVHIVHMRLRFHQYEDMG